MKVAKKVGEPEQIGSFAVAIGLGSTLAMRAVNLPPRASPDHPEGSLPVWSVRVQAFSWRRCSRPVHDGHGKLAAQQHKLDGLTRNYHALPPPPPGPSVAEQQLAGEKDARVGALSTALSEPHFVGQRVLREFSLVLRPTSADDARREVFPSHHPERGQRVVPRLHSSRSRAGRTRMTALPGLLSRLQVIPDLTNVQLISSTLSLVGKQQVVDFSIVADIKAPAGAGS